MKKTKFSAVVMAALIVLSGCGMNNTAKGGLIGGGAGAGIGAMVGNLIGKNAGGTLAGAGIGAAVGTAAGVLIGKKMDKLKAQAETAVANAQVETVKDANGLDAVKVTLASGVLFPSGKATLSKESMASLTAFTNDVLKVNPDCDVAIQGYTDNTGFKGSTAEESIQKNITLSQQRADAVKSYILAQGAGTNQIKSSVGYGENNPVASNDTKEGREQNRRVEIYLYASEAMVQSAEAGTLQ
ncbi:MAG: OmpA family protein [Bacteroidaceae bacterium]|nr:OmpA family protein [Bacteroidaceae bacterium]MBR1519803.1 OmpA family protein [Bacteroidaceae bacterium]